MYFLITIGDFILEQMRLNLAKKDYQRVVIVSKKIAQKFLLEKENQDLKLRFFDLMIQHALFENDYLSVSKYYSQIYNTEQVKSDETVWKGVLENIILFASLSPFDNEQSDLVQRLNLDQNLRSLPLYQQYLKCFVTNELMRWPKIQEIYGPTFHQKPCFDNSEKGVKRFSDLHKRVIEHVYFFNLEYSCYCKMLFPYQCQEIDTTS